MFPFMSRSEINVENMKAWALICRVKMEVMIMPDLLDERIRNYEKKVYVYVYICERKLIKPLFVLLYLIP